MLPSKAAAPAGEQPGWRHLVAGATRLLTEAGVPSPQVDALALQRHVAQIPVLAMAPPPTDEQRRRFAELVDRRRRREPLQHLTGRMTFRYLELCARPGAFIVRPETELVAEHAIEAARQVPHPRVVDLCSGSGAIALALATEVPAARVWAVELSAEAAAVARENIAEHAPHVRLVVADAAAALPELVGVVDVVVSNPPYIPPTAVAREAEVRDHDPDLALYGGGVDGLDVPRAVIARAAQLLRTGGTFVMEHGDEQARAVREALADTGDFEDIRTEQDLAGRDRMVVARRARGRSSSRQPTTRQPMSRQQTTSQQTTSQHETA
ncbi:MAG TPA: peptide chain release factor N(5)-glutamine methyltransferase [Actinomycetaceae bacterium]|nr:peptide chain release factor N(5)-glutamine methyltransferase [Actinomycetaceae bacterium]